jgi:AraC family transcriptional regulator
MDMRGPFPGVGEFKGVPPTLQLTSGDFLRGARVEQRWIPPGETVAFAPESHIVNLVTRGSIACEGAWLGDRRLRFTAFCGSISVMPARAPTSFVWTGGCEMVSVLLDQDVVKAAISDEGLPESMDLRPQQPIDDLAARRIALNLLDEVQAGMPTGRLYSESLTLALVWHLLRDQRLPRAVAQSGGLRPNQLRRITAYIHDRLAADLTVRELARMSELSCAHFARQFKGSTGLSPHQYVFKERIDEACRLLETTPLKLVEVALRSGFAGQSSFTTAFGRATGSTPEAFRRAAQR